MADEKQEPSRPQDVERKNIEKPLGEGERKSGGERQGGFQNSRPPQRRRTPFRRFTRRKVCAFCQNKIEVDYKDVKRLQRFMSGRGKIIPRRISGACAGHQRQLTRAIRRARVIAILPYKAE